MMDMAHTPVPRKKISIFGNYWIVGGGDGWGGNN